MKKAFIILLSVLACFVFVSCEEEPDVMSVDEFVDLYNEYLEVEYAIADEHTVKYYYEDTYNLGPKVLVVKLDNGVTYYTIDGVSKANKDEYDNEIQACKTAHTDWEIIKTSGTRKYRVEKYDPDKTIVINTEVKDLGNGTTECSYNATIDGENKVSYVYRTNSTSSTTYTYFKFNGVEVSPNAACLFILKD